MIDRYKFRNLIDQKVRGTHTFLSRFQKPEIYIGHPKNLIGKVVSYKITYNWDKFRIGQKI